MYQVKVIGTKYQNIICQSTVYQDLDDSGVVINVD